MSKIQVNEIVNHFDNGAPDCPKGFTVSSGISTFTGAIDANGSLDVDGHTNLDNVNISGVVTASSFVGNVTGNADSATTATNAQGLTGSPSISVSSLVSTGNVTIGGTLTYDDVTSIDSVGIITAKAGIHVTGGNVGIGTDNPGGNLQVGSSGASHVIITQNTGIDIDGGAINLYQATTNTNAVPFLISSDVSGTETEKLRVTAGGRVGVGTQTPKTDLDISQKTGAVALPQGTTAQRPSGSAPYIRKNTTNNALEYFDGTSWVEIITDYFPTGSTILG